MEILVLLACLCLTQALNPNHERMISPRIAGGIKAPAGSRPYQVGIYPRETEGVPLYMCGGVLVHERWVLTAAHCWTLGEMPATVHLGVMDFRETEEDGVEIIDGQWVVEGLNLEYGVGLADDIALIKLDTPATIGDKIQAIPIACACSEVAEGTDLLVSGWGFRKSVPTVQAQLRQVEVTVLNKDECDFFMFSTERSICAAAPGKDACTNDSGSPLVSGYDLKKHVDTVTLHGLVQGGIGCANPNKPGSYVNVVKYCSWIAKMTSGEVSCGAR